MASVRPMTAHDLFHLTACNLDPLTETYDIAFYLDYLSKWPELCSVIEGTDGRIEAYMLGKLESSPFPPPVSPYHPDTNPDPTYLPWHGHVTTLTVAASARHLGLATRLTEALERESEARAAWFVDLYVRVENEVALQLYRKMGYSVFRRVVGYYNDDSDAFDMRKPLARDKDRKHVRPDEVGVNVKVSPADVW